MRFVMFYHSLVSDWNHGNAHFLRGVCSELLWRGHSVKVYEPADGWSRRTLIAEHGLAALTRFKEAYPELESTPYDEASLDLDQALDGADLVIVHEWNTHSLVKKVGKHRANSKKYRLLFHDTHHRSVSDPGSISAYDLEHYDGVLAFGEVIRETYVRAGWARNAWTWHEAADARVFRPLKNCRIERDLVWIGNWGDEERTAELQRFLIDPVRRLGLKARVHGVRYPRHAIDELASAEIEYRGWAPNHEVPTIFATAGATVHIPRRPYVEALPGIPTIRVFEALACGIPLVCSEWRDAEGLFTPGKDYLLARTPDEMESHLRTIIADREFAAKLASQGRETILNRHTCSHRVDQLMRIYRSIAPAAAA